MKHYYIAIGALFLSSLQSMQRDPHLPMTVQYADATTQTQTISQPPFDGPATGELMHFLTKVIKKPASLGRYYESIKKLLDKKANVNIRIGDHTLFTLCDYEYRDLLLPYLRTASQETQSHFLWHLVFHQNMQLFCHVHASFTNVNMHVFMNEFYQKVNTDPKWKHHGDMYMFVRDLFSGQW